MSDAPSGLTRVAVVGGGIAGLTLAAALDPARFDVTLVEAQPERTTGAALGLWPGARRTLTRLGVALPAPTKADHGGLYRLDGARVATVRGPDLAMVMRPALMEALAAAVPGSVRRVMAEVTDPSTLDADLVVGADGVRSRVRGLVQPGAAERRETPYVTLRGIVPAGAAADRLRPLVGEYWGAGTLFGLAPVGDALYWFTGHVSDLGPEPLDVTTVVAEARERFVSPAPHLREVLDAAGDDTLATRLWVTPPMHRYVSGRYVVIGDAAHAALPNLGRGASDAVLDAASLARILNTNRSLASWQARRLPVTQVARTVAGWGMRVALSPTRDLLWRRLGTK